MSEVVRASFMEKQRLLNEWSRYVLDYRMYGLAGSVLPPTLPERDMTTPKGAFLNAMDKLQLGEVKSK